ncbi:TonB-dependent receptor [Rufibacter tibetensis]|uniref:TonB-dependent receptor n=1 Tax=Rufibacter tibetensis TaxID=512763 RepID=UPI00146FF77C|nr:TonB-dependent receptor [Rufibacter tibetensis]
MTGTIQNAADSTALPGAIVLLQQSDVTSPAAASTDVDGKFRFERIAPGEYIVKVTYFGFKSLTKSVRVDQRSVDLGTLLLQEEPTAIREILIIGHMALGEQLGDTTQFNAGAFKVNPSASAEDLVQKMPGITIQDGKIQAQGEDVQEILVDGKRFFEGDVDAALRNLPAEVIQNIQIFDKQSDQAEFSGFNDGKRARTINIVTKPERRRGQFGQASAGYGTDSRYMLGASVNFFSGHRRLTVTGIRNNINVSDYSIGETPGGGMRGRRGGSNGIITSNRIGLNFSDEWRGRIEISGNYVLDYKQFEQGQRKERNYFLSATSADSGRVYSENSNSLNADTRQRFTMRLKYAMNDRNEILFKPNFSIRTGNSDTYFFGRTSNGNGPINQTENNAYGNEAGLEGESDLHFRHRFTKKGRTFSTSLKNNFSTGEGESYRVAENIFHNQENPFETLDQYRNNDSRGYAWEANASFTEPIGRNARMQLEYQISNKVDDADRRTFYLAEQTGHYTLLDTTLSNSFKSDYLTQQIKFGYQYNAKRFRLEGKAELQKAKLENNQEFPQAYGMERVFYSVLPSAELEYTFSASRNLRLEYQTNTTAPSFSQLQDVIDQSNPLHIRSGNPDLKQSYQNRISLRYRGFNPQTNKVFYVGLRGSITQNNITNSTVIADRAIALSDEVELKEGSQFTRPVNLDEDYWDLRTFFNYGQPVHFIKSKVSFSGSVGFSKRPGIINERTNISKATNFRLGVSLSSNISEEVDFNLSTNSNYNMVENTLLPQKNNNYFNQSTNLKYTWAFLNGFVYRTELNHQFNAGLSAGYDNSYLLWNMSLSKKVFADKSGEISLSVNDLLEQNNSITRNVTELYIEDVQSSILQRFLMLTFTYSIKNFAGGTK